METQHLKQRENETGKEKVDNLFIFFFFHQTFLSHLLLLFYSGVFIRCFWYLSDPTEETLIFFFIPLTTILSLGDLDDKLSRSFLDYYY